MSIGNFVRELVLSNPEISHDDAVKQVKERYPEAKTTTSCIAWYKSDMRKKGLLSGGRAKAPRTEEVVAADIERVEKQLEALKQELEKLIESQLGTEEEA